MSSAITRSLRRRRHARNAFRLAQLRGCVRGCTAYLSVRNATQILPRGELNLQPREKTGRTSQKILFFSLFFFFFCLGDITQLHLHRNDDDSAIFNLAGAIISSSLSPLSVFPCLSIIILPGFIFILAIITGHEARGTSRKLTTECRVIFTRFPRRNIGRCWGLA